MTLGAENDYRQTVTYSTGLNALVDPFDGPRVMLLNGELLHCNDADVIATNHVVDLGRQ
ncbi:MAG: hypothetical protein JO314_04065 [Acidobacteria bacterium]|nr:hypothetical protein [Acidobacteriota bacterium]